MNDHDRLEQMEQENVASMRVVGDRCLRAEKIAYTLDYVMEHRPGEQQVQIVLADLLHDYLASTATMVQVIKQARLAIDLAKLAQHRATKEISG